MIESGKEQKENLEKTRFVSARENTFDSVTQENILRPKSLDEYVGQSNIKKHLSVSIASATIRKTPLEHILFYGPPGLGKTTLANIISLQMGSNIKSSSGPAIEKQSDLVSILSNLEESDVFFIDEIHRLKPHIEEILYTAMEDFSVDIMVGTGNGAQSVKIPIKPFTLVGATTKLSSLSSPLRDRFGNIFKLDFYDEKDISQILFENSKKIDLKISDNSIKNISKRSRGTPRIANRLLKIVRDYEVVGEKINDENILSGIFEGVGIDEMGLDYLDMKYLKTLFEKFDSGPVGLKTISSTIGEEENTIEDVVEPFLLQIGFLDRSPRGRKLTKSAIEYVEKLTKLV